LSFLVRCGPVFEEAHNNGISHFLEHMLFRGTPEYPSGSQLNMALDRVGAEANAATFSDMTVVSMRLLPEALSDGLELFRRMLSVPVCEGITAERRIIIEECLEDFDEEGRLIAIDQLSSQLLFGKHPYSLPITGEPKVLKRLTRHDLHEHLQRHYRPDAGVICLSGAIETATVMDAVRERFGNWRNPAGPARLSSTLPEPIFAGPQLVRVDSPRSQVNARISFRTVSFADPDYYLLKALIRILDAPAGSPLRQKVQDENGFCYNFSAGLDAYERAGAVHIDMTVQPDRLYDALEVSLNVLADLREQGVPPEIVEHMIAQYIKGKRFAATDHWDFCSRYAFRELFPSPHDFATEFHLTQKIVSADLQRLIHQVFRRRHLGLTLVGPISRALAKRIESLLAAFPE